MKNLIKGSLIGALVATVVSLALAQPPSWTNPRTWVTGEVLTADLFNVQFRDNILNLRSLLPCTTAIGGTPRAWTTFLRGDCEWSEPPILAALAVDTDSSTTVSCDLCPCWL